MQAVFVYGRAIKFMHNIAIIGAMGAVGQELLFLLEKKCFPVGQLRLFGSARSKGKVVRFKGENISVKSITRGSFRGVDIAFFCANEEISKQYVPQAVEEGARVIDKSSFYRLERDVPLVIPEVNGEDIKEHHRVVASPNCMVTIGLMALGPLHKAFGLRRFWGSTYQSVSGSGIKGVEELKAQTKAWMKGEALVPRVYEEPIAFNVIPQIGHISGGGCTQEEEKIIEESKKILKLPNLIANVTCVRVPVYRSHAISLDAEFERSFPLSEVYEALKVPGLSIFGNECATPIMASYQENCLVGRVRLNSFCDNALSLWACGDQLWKGAALNALQIAQVWIG